MHTKFEVINSHIQHNCKSKEEAMLYYTNQIERHEEKKTTLNIYNYLNHFYKTRVKDQQAEIELQYFTLEEVVIKKFEQRIQLRIATWLNNNDHNVAEPIFITNGLRYMMTKGFLD